jgi:hypothetical protein
MTWLSAKISSIEILPWNLQLGKLPMATLEFHGISELENDGQILAWHL